MRVAILGGTGAFGRALAKRLHALGEEVTIGSRSADRARELAAAIGVQGAANGDAAVDADLVVLSVPSSAAEPMARKLADEIGETPLLCVASELSFTDNGVEPGREYKSLAESVAELVQSPVASGFQTLAAVRLAQHEPSDEDVLVCGEDPAKQLGLDIGARLVAGRAIDAGPLASSRGLEGMTAVLLNVNKRYRVHAGLRITGLP